MLANGRGGGGLSKLGLSSRHKALCPHGGTGAERDPQPGLSPGREQEPEPALGAWQG